MSTWLIDQAMGYIADYQPSCTEITLPYTPSKTGLLLVMLRGTYTGRIVQSYNNTKPAVVDGYNANGGYVTGVLFVQKNVQVSLREQINIQSVQYYFVPLSLS